MLHVFVSGFRKAYRVALLNAVCAPIGARQTFTYSLNKNISPADATAISQLPPGTKTIISFVDRFATGGYSYMAVRKAELLATVLDTDRIEISVRFGEWPLPAAHGNYSAWVGSTLVPMGAPHLTANDPQNQLDGSYALNGPEPAQDAFQAGDGWKAIVERLSTSTVLATTDKQVVVFARLDVLEAKANKVVPWSEDAQIGAPALLLERSENYRARVNYVFPLQQTDNDAEVLFNLKLSAGLQPRGSLVGSAAALARAAEFDFSVAALNPSSRASIMLEFSPAADSQRAFITPRLELPITLSYSRALIVALVIIGLAYVIGTGLLTQFTQPNPPPNAFWAFYGAPLLQYLGIIAMFHFFGLKLT